MRTLPLLAVAACLTLGCAVSPGGSAEGGEGPFGRGLWPLYGQDRRAWAGVREARALGPLLHWEEAPERRLFEFRPLLSSLHDEEQTRWDLLFPLAWRRSTADRQQSALLLLGRSGHDVASSRELTVFGLGFRGRTSTGKRYGGLFPLGGVFLELFGFQRVRFALWPLFARGTRKDYRETQLLWPIFAYGRGAGRFKLRVWPLFGVEKREGFSARYFFLWPFVHVRRDRLETDAPERAFYLLPLYGRRDRGPLRTRFYLFPLFARQWNSTRPEVQRLQLLWPIYERSSDGAGGQSLAVRPLWSRQRTARGSSWSLLLGLLSRREIETEEVQERWWQALWVGTFGSRAAGEAALQRNEVWPLYRRESRLGKDGVMRGSLRVPYLIPLRGLDPDGWDRHYNRLLELYGSRWRDSEHRSSWLWGLVETRSAPGLRWVSWGGWLHLGP